MTQDSWQERALISIAAQGGTAYTIQASTRTIDFGGGEKETEGQPNLAGGRVEKWTPETDRTVTFEGWIVDLAPANNDMGWLLQGFHTTRGNWDSSQPIQIDNSRNREKFNVAVLWTNDPTITTGASTVSMGYEGYRRILINCRIVSMNVQQTDGEVKVTARLKAPAFQKNGDSNFREQSTNATATLSSISLPASTLGGL